MSTIDVQQCERVNVSIKLAALSSAVRFSSRVSCKITLVSMAALPASPLIIVYDRVTD